MNPKHGGKRAGSGRPVQDEARGEMKKYSVFLYPDQWDKLKRINDNRSEAIRNIIDSWGMR
jgi:hypothetical protein